jgi:hypothetical protein
VEAILGKVRGKEDARCKVRNNLFLWRPFCEVLKNRRMPVIREGIT